MRKLYSDGWQWWFVQYLLQDSTTSSTECFFSFSLVFASTIKRFINNFVRSLTALIPKLSIIELLRQNYVNWLIFTSLLESKINSISNYLFCIWTFFFLFSLFGETADVMAKYLLVQIIPSMVIVSCCVFQFEMVNSRNTYFQLKSI